MAVSDELRTRVQPFVAKYGTRLKFDMHLFEELTDVELIYAMSAKINEAVCFDNETREMMEAVQEEWRTYEANLAEKVDAAIDKIPSQVTDEVNRYTSSDEFQEQLDATVEPVVEKHTQGMQAQIDANKSAISGLQTTVAGKADASALTALTGRVTQTETKNSTQDEEIKALKARGVWLSEYGASQTGLQNAVAAASFDNPLVIDVDVTMTQPIDVSSDLRVIGLGTINLTPFQASAGTTAMYYFNITGAERVEFDNVRAVSQAIYTPGINILNSDNTGSASNVFLAQVTNVGESVFNGCTAEYCSLVRQNTGNQSVDNSLYLYGCRGVMSENFVNTVNGSVHIHDCDIQCSSNTRTASGYSEYYHGIYIGAVFFDSEVENCNFTAGGDYFVSSALHFNDSSGHDHDVNVTCIGNTVTGYQSAGSFNYGNVIVDGLYMPEGAMGGAKGSVLTVNTQTSIRNAVAKPASSQYSGFQINSSVHLNVESCSFDGISTLFTTTNSTSGASADVHGSFARTYKANTGSVTTMPLTMRAFESTFENFANFATAARAVDLLYSNCTLRTNADSGQTYINVATGSKFTFTGTLDNSGSITLQGEGVKNIDCIQRLWNGTFNHYTTISGT